MRTPGVPSLLAGLALLWAPIGAAAQATVEVEQFGLGGFVRPGDWTPVRLAVTSELDATVEAEVVLEVPTADGDIAEVSRLVVLDPGQPAGVWLYPRLLPAPTAQGLLTSVFPVRVWQVEGGRRVRSLAAERISPAVAAISSVGVDMNEGMLGVIGTGRMGLDAFQAVPSGSRFIPSMNEVTRIVRPLSPQTLPDRWEGFGGLEAVVWSEGDPKQLAPATAQALREWILRGGHLVIVLPEAGDPWGLGGGAHSALSDLVPGAPVVVEGAPVTSLLPILSRSTESNNRRATMRVRRWGSDPGNGYAPLLALPSPRDAGSGELRPREGSLDGAVVAVQRIVGHGRITCIGIDIDAIGRRSLQQNSLPQADVFWNRVLGRRADAPTGTEYAALAAAESPRLFTGGNTTDLGSGETVTLAIDMRGQAAIGLLGAFVVFFLYWVIAGPGGFALLKRAGAVRHAWLAFVAVAILFGAGAWSIGAFRRAEGGRVQHLSVVDIVRVEGEASVRATSWFSAFLPGYARTSVALEGDPRAILAPWAPPPIPPTSGFPDTQRFVIPSSSPGSYSVPARATATLFETNWLGATRESSAGAPLADTIGRPLAQTATGGAAPRLYLTGVIRHALPSPLRDVTIIHVGPFRSPLPRLASGGSELFAPSDALPNPGRIARMGSWNPGEPIELAAALYAEGPSNPFDTGPGTIAHDLDKRYFEPMATDAFGGRLDTMLSPERRMMFLEMLSLYAMLQPPEYLKNPPANVASLRALRTLGRSIDLSPWFVRPCLIVEGFLDWSEPPMAISLGGEVAPGTGTTMVRVIFPLPVDASLLAPTGFSDGPQVP